MLIINAKQPAVEGEDERATDEEVQRADVAVGEGWQSVKGTVIHRCVLAE